MKRTFWLWFSLVSVIGALLVTVGVLIEAQQQPAIEDICGKLNSAGWTADVEEEVALWAEIFVPALGNLLYLDAQTTRQLCTQVSGPQQNIDEDTDFCLAVDNYLWNEFGDSSGFAQCMGNLGYAL